VLLARAFHDAAGAGADHEALHVPADRARDVMVLAVNIGGDHAAQGHVLGAGRDRREEAARQEQPVQLAEQYAGFDVQQAGRVVEGQDAIGQRRTHHRAATHRQRRIAVRPAHAA
jgi:hypothetical protein